MNTTIAPNSTGFDHYQFLTVDDRRELNRIDSLSELAEIAIKIMKRLPKKVDMISGPISTGPGNSLKERLRIFQLSIEKLAQDPDLTVFSQIPFENNIHAFAQRWRRIRGSKRYCQPILDIFYQRIFKSGCVGRLHFMPNYKLSVGAQWEHDIAPSFGIGQVYLPGDFIDDIVERVQQEMEFRPFSV
ncbi:MAG: hypothetical protein RLY66_627 [Candidatus Parcubacteria bacterium]|jgi:hypothetical protein